MDVIGSIEAKVRSLASALAVATGQNLDLVESLLSLDTKTQEGKLKRLEVALGIIVEKAQIWSKHVEGERFDPNAGVQNAEVVQ